MIELELLSVDKVQAYSISNDATNCLKGKEIKLNTSLNQENVYSLNRSFIK